VLAQTHFAAGTLMPLLLAPLMGRSACIALASLGRARDPNSLSAPIIAGARPYVALPILCAALTTVAVCVNIKACLALTAALALVIFRLYALSLRQGGLNGDFLGASVVLTELLTLAAILI
jgi:adenosylcobinamide-GDP ribazoletransferase